ncbi:hypothetical protein N7499_006327 [Penicillium canescens]|nr:hypothetical protein N7499_006327 [Penicillium canescens]KAJ6176750.1 hypothetical protein N7485_003664 [Penicillium canescens]
MKLFETPIDIWLSIKDFLTPADVENIINTTSTIWKQIFKDTSWLEFALAFDGCSPVLIGHLSAYRPRKSSNRLYLALLAGDYSGDLRYESERFFAALQDGWKYDESRYEVDFPSGITLNIYEVIKSLDTVELPLEKVFTNTKQGVYSEYCYYNNPAIKELRSSDIVKWDPDYKQPRPYMFGGWNGPACKGRDIKHGCRITLLNQHMEKDYCLFPCHKESKLWAKMTRSVRDCSVR